MQDDIELTEMEEEEIGEKPRVSPLLILARDLILLIVFVLAFRAVVAEANWIPTSSMVPTLEENDKIIVDKISLHFSEIHRGDIVTFFPPEGMGAPPDKRHVRFIKRVIGLPGETVEVRRGEGVFINGQKLIEPYVRFYPDNRSLPAYSWGPITLPEDHYFLLGDNRQGSQDSHVWGLCPEENIIGRAMFRYWPVYRIGIIEDKSFQEHYFAEGYY